MVGVGAYLVVLLSPVLRNDDLKHFLQQVHFQLQIGLGGGAEARGGIDLYQPGLAVGV